SFDVDLAAFAEEPFARVSEPSERDDPEPFRPLLLRAVAIREALGRGQREIRHVLSGVGQRPNHWIRSEIADHHHFVDCHCRLPPWLSAPASAKRQGVPWFQSRATFFRAAPSPETGGPCADFETREVGVLRGRDKRSVRRQPMARRCSWSKR